MNNKKLLAEKRRTLCHELGHALYFLKEMEPIYYVKGRTFDNGIKLQRKSTLDVYLAGDGFHGIFYGNGQLFHSEIQAPAEIEICYHLAGLAMENAVYCFGLAPAPTIDGTTDLEEGTDVWRIREIIKKGAYNGGVVDLWQRVTLLSMPYRNKIYKQVLAITRDIEKISDSIYMEEPEILKLLGLS